MRRAMAVLTATAALIFGVLPAASGEVATTVTEVAFHPSIAAQPESGRFIQDLGVKDGEVYLGYGDYGSNTGPIDVATYNPSAGTYDVKATANTEQIGTYRKFNGNLYAPWVDPKGSGGIYSSDQGGAWGHFGTDVSNVHIFDVAVLPNGVQVAVGSANNADGTFAGATAFVSRDDGATWEAEMHDKLRDSTGWDRYYWVTVSGGKAYMQAMNNVAIYGQADYPVRVFDGERWSKINKSADCFVGSGKNVETFDGKSYCSNGTVLVAGRPERNRGNGIHANDFYNDGTYLYALTGGGVSRTDGRGWEQVATFTLPDEAQPHSVAVLDGVTYVGGSNGKLYRVN